MDKFAQKFILERQHLVSQYDIFLEPRVYVEYSKTWKRNA